MSFDQSFDDCSRAIKVRYLTVGVAKPSLPLTMAMTIRSLIVRTCL